MNKKVVALVLACVLIFSTIVAGTLAYLLDTTKSVVNTFTFGMVDINLTETGAQDEDGVLKNSFKLVPGQTYKKDPTITVVDGSEASYVFVKVEEGNNVRDYVDFTIAEGWTALDGVNNVYYREYTSGAATYTVLKGGDGDLANGKVTCKTSVTPEQVESAKVAAPTLSFTAYAIQKDATFTTAKAAWDAMQTQLNPAP